MSKQEIGSLKPDEKINSVYLIARSELKTDRNGKFYIYAIFQDQTGRIDGFLWNATKEMIADVEQGHLIRVTGKVDVFNERLQIKIIEYAKVEHDITDIVKYLPKSDKDPKELNEKLAELLGSIENENLQKLRDAYIEDKEFMKLFTRVPAGVRMHHAYVNGLLDHTVSVLKLVDAVTSFYPELDRDFLMISAFLHDAGKIQELSFTEGFDYSNKGKLIGHISLGAIELSKRIDKIENFPVMLADKLIHCILAHHGSYEFGSPKLPMFAEAIALHHLENFDSDLAGFFSEKAQSTAEFGFSRKFNHEMLYELDTESEISDE
ncbi:MAG: HD domain-containing protein [Planctomycetes bacterium]|nr:HD domain-containing protein [Planctomycetota bacterium]